MRGTKRAGAGAGSGNRAKREARGWRENDVEPDSKEEWLDEIRRGGRERQKKTGGIKKKWGWNFKWKDKRGERASGKGVGRKGGLRVISLKVPMKGACGKCKERTEG